MNPLSVLIIEDDPATCSSFIHCAYEMSDILLVDVVNNATSAIKAIYHHEPDAIILDLELHLGGGTGFDVLKEINNMDVSIRPYVLIATNNSSSITHSYARKLGADFILTKHQAGYSEKSALSFLQDIASVLKSNPSGTSMHIPELPITKSNRIKQRITKELHLVGINPKATGFQYLLDAIMMVMNSPSHNYSTAIAKRHGKTETSVERAMQNAINRAWKTSSIDDLLKHYTAKIDSEKGVPTITEFIHYYALKLNNEYI